MHIYLDESGNLTRDREKFFIVGSFTVGEPSRLTKAFRKWQRTKFPRKLRTQAEVKFNHAGLYDTLREKTIRFLAAQDIRIFYTFLEKRNTPEQYREAHQIQETGQLYVDIVSETLSLYLPVVESAIWIFHDPRPLKGISKTAFHNSLRARLIPQAPGSRIEIMALDSSTSPLIQVADWVCGALARFHEQKSMGEVFYKILRNNIVREKEMFQDYWNTRWS